jgi:hypothetical protein
MNKFLLFILIFLSGNIFGQKYSIGISGGYGFGIQRDTMGVNGNISKFSYSTTSNKTEKDIVKASFGKGLNINLNFDYTFLKYFRLGCDASYHKGAKVSVNNSYDSYTYYQDNNFSSKNDTAHYWNNISQWQFTPNIKMQYGNNTKLYIKLGMVTGLSGKMAEVINTTSSHNDHYQSGFGYPPHYIDTSYSKTTHKLTDYRNGHSFGFNGTIGIDDAISDNFFIFAEVSYVRMKWSPKEYKIKEYTENNIDKLATVSSVKVENPTRAYSSINLLIGVRYAFGRKPKKTEIPLTN